MQSESDECSKCGGSQIGVRQRYEVVLLAVPLSYYSLGILFAVEKWTVQEPRARACWQACLLAFREFSSAIAL